MSEVRFPFLDLRDANAPFQRQLAEATARVVASGRYIGGPENDVFELELARLCCAEHAVGVSNGLDALRLALRAAVEIGRLRSGDGVAVAANTYVASVLAITDAGLRPVLVDPDETTMNLSARGLARAIDSGAVTAVMPVHLYGRVAWDDQMDRMAREHALFVIEDVAQAVGATVELERGRVSAGAIGNVGAFSFYPTKNVGALGDAGAVVTSDSDIAGTVRAMSNYGSDRRYHNIYRGFNCRLDPLQAAVLNVKLPHIDAINGSRRSKAAIYDSLIRHPQVVKPLFDSRFPQSMVWHQYVVRHPRRDLFRQWLAEHGVQTDVHYATPPHRQPCYAALPHGELPVTELLASEVVSLPIAESTSVDDARQIAQIINSMPRC